MKLSVPLPVAVTLNEVIGYINVMHRLGDLMILVGGFIIYAANQFKGNFSDYLIRPRKYENFFAGFIFTLVVIGIYGWIACD